MTGQGVKKRASREASLQDDSLGRIEERDTLRKRDVSARDWSIVNQVKSTEVESLSSSEEKNDGLELP